VLHGNTADKSALLAANLTKSKQIIIIPLTKITNLRRNCADLLGTARFQSKIKSTL
jgi:UDP-3-O-[3-hydroxymyristoyl] glucosamine N-acyltransferase